MTSRRPSNDCTTVAIQSSKTSESDTFCTLKFPPVYRAVGGDYLWLKSMTLSLTGRAVNWHLSTFTMSGLTPLFQFIILPNIIPVSPQSTLADKEDFMAAVCTVALTKFIKLLSDLNLDTPHSFLVKGPPMTAEAVIDTPFHSQVTAMKSRADWIEVMTSNIEACENAIEVSLASDDHVTYDVKEIFHSNRRDLAHLKDLFGTHAFLLYCM